MTIAITKVWGIGSQTADLLKENGFNYAEDLANANEITLQKIPGFGATRAQRVINDAQDLVAEATEPKPEKKTKKKKKKDKIKKSTPPKSDKKKKKDKKKSKKKKDKKKSK